MFERVAAFWDLLRPRTIAQTRKTVDDLVAEVRELKRAQRDAAIDLRQQLDALAVRESQLRAIWRADAEMADEVPHLGAILDGSRIAAHVEAAVAKSPLCEEPFPHAVIPNVVPRDFYDALLRGIPPVELFADRPFNKQQLTVPFAVAPLYSRLVWSYMTDVVIKTALMPALVDKFRARLGAWIAANWPSLAENPLGPPVELKTADGRILLRGRGYTIPPHRDPKWGFLTVILYLARPKDSETWGTQLYAVGDDEEARGPAPHWIDANRCRRSVDIPFRRNTALVLLNSTGAHGASIPEDAEPPDLQRYVYQFRIGPSSMAIRALTSLLPEDRRAFWEGKTSDY